VQAHCLNVQELERSILLPWKISIVSGFKYLSHNFNVLECAQRYLIIYSLELTRENQLEVVKTQSINWCMKMRVGSQVGVWALDLLDYSQL
jgi:hypothetical protein